VLSRGLRQEHQQNRARLERREELGLNLNELSTMDAVAQAELVRRREVTPLELVDAAIARIERVNPTLNAVITTLFEKARKAAVSPDLPDGPFRGVPFLLKDLGAASDGDPYYLGMRVLRDARFVAPHDTYLVAKFKAAGFLSLGKTNTPELGLQETTEPEAFGPTHNPWDPTRSTGGSSGGSAAAVASRMVAVAHANDGGGSIRIPASECGLVGLKPSRGHVSWGPNFGDFWHGLAINHVVTRSVRDSAAVLDVISGNMPGDPYSAPPQRRPFVREAGADPGRLRVGFMKRTPEGISPLHSACVAAVQDAAKLFESLGHTVEESHPASLDETLLASKPLMVLIGSLTALDLEQIGALLGKSLTAEDVEPYTWSRAEQGFRVSACQCLAAIQWLQVWSRRVAQWWSDGFDLLFTPTIASPPPALRTLITTPFSFDESLQRFFDLTPFAFTYNVTGQPAISLPLHWTPEGLPVGVQLVAAMGSEDVLIRIASQIEQAQPWIDRLPPVHA
jgi:amidase